MFNTIAPVDRSMPPTGFQRAEEELPGLYAAQGLRVPLAVMVSALFLASLAQEQAPISLLTGWLGAVAATLALRWWVLMKATTATHIPILTRMNAIAVVSGLGGLVHGQSVLLWPYMDDLAHAVQSMWALGLCSNAVVTQFGYLRVYLPYLLPLLIPMALAWAQALAVPGQSLLVGPSGIMLLMVLVSGGLLIVLAKDTFSLFTDSFESRKRLGVALQQAEAANRAKTRFLASASHDLRQPMHTLSLFSAALAMRPLDAAAREITNQMNLALQALSTQLDALLDVSKLDAGVIPVNPRNFDLRPMLVQLRDDFEPLAARKRLTLAFDAPQQVICHTDPLLLERVLRNLLDNAIKYSDRGSIRFGVRPILSPANSTVFQVKVYEIYVADQGCGIEVAEQERVFEEFYQIDNPQRDRARGLGLGLSIVRRLADLLDLGLQMQSTLGDGTRFALTLKGGVATQDAPAKLQVELPALQGINVLVIDDEVAVREGMRAVLEAMGCTVQLAQGSLGALALAAQAPPDIVLADFRLRGFDDGISAVRQLRAVYPDLPALLVSGDTAPQRLRDAQMAGLKLLHKPASVDVLACAMHEELKRHSKTRHDA
jgi:signal transduction histidine kinase/CheY-like chemotaxis protein